MCMKNLASRLRMTSKATFATSEFGGPRWEIATFVLAPFVRSLGLALP